jgi:branched-chain amino acid transport system ATP-binding protein/urea transport system ATP-binding protein
MLTVSELTAGYQHGSRVLDELSLEIRRGEIVALMGRNGMGKTTLVKTIAGHLTEAAGSINYGGREICGLPPHEIANLGIGYVPQGREIFADFTAEENLLMGVIGKRHLPNHVPSWAYNLFPILRERRNQRAGTMSGGQQQQLAIVRALVGEPDLLLLDEPSEGIQPSIVQEISKAVRRIAAEKGLTVLLVEQNLEFVLGLAGRCLIIENGRILAEMAADRVRHDPGLVRKYLSV